MKLKNEIFSNGFIPAVNSLLEQKLPVVESYKLLKLAEEINAKSKIYTDARVALAKQYAKKDENGEPIEEDGKYVIEDQEAFNKEFRELVALEEEYDISKLVLGSEIRLSANEVAALENILEINL